MKPRHLLALPFILPLASPAWSGTCEQTLGLHGFKATAQVVCGFGQRENEALEWARSCARRQDPAVNALQVRMGALVFEATERRMGRAAACRDIFEKFKGILYWR